MDAWAAGQHWEELGVGWLWQRAGETSRAVGEGTASTLHLQPSHMRDARRWGTGTGGWQAGLCIHVPAAPTLWFCRKALLQVRSSRGK